MNIFELNCIMRCSDMKLEMFLNLINVLCQIILTITAIVAIIITIKQIQNKSKSKLKVSYKCGMGLYKIDDNCKIVIGVSINLINIGLGPVYYDDCGLIFVNGKKYSSKRSYPGIIANTTIEKDSKVLMPGESSCESIYEIEWLLDCVNKDKKISNRDKVYIYVDLCNGMQFAWDTGDTYEEFLFKYNQVKNRKEKNELCDK